MPSTQNSTTSNSHILWLQESKVVGSHVGGKMVPSCMCHVVAQHASWLVGGCIFIAWEYSANDMVCSAVLLLTAPQPNGISQLSPDNRGASDTTMDMMLPLKRMTLSRSAAEPTAARNWLNASPAGHQQW